jgi:hypothetical protein
LYVHLPLCTKDIRISGKIGGIQQNAKTHRQIIETAHPHLLGEGQEKGKKKRYFVLAVVRA